MGPSAIPCSFWDGFLSEIFGLQIGLMEKKFCGTMKQILKHCSKVGDLEIVLAIWNFFFFLLWAIN